MYYISLAEIIRSLIGAWRIFLRDPNGVAFFQNDIPAFWKSFWCALLIFPIYLLLVWSNANYPDGAIDDLFRASLFEVTAYTLGWVVWPVLMLLGVKIMEREKDYWGYIVLYNWSAAPMILFGLIIAALEFSEALPAAVIVSLSIGFLIWRLVVHIFIFKMTMQISTAMALPFVLGDFFVGQIILVIKYNMLVVAP